MITHNRSKRNAKALLQVEATIYLGITSPIMKFVARQSFRVGNVCIAQGETCYAVKSERREHRYYIVHFDAVHQTWQCSCGQGRSNHHHLTTAREYVEKRNVNVSTVTEVRPVQQNRTENVENGLALDVNVKSTVEQWKAIQKRDRARQKALKAEYWAKIREIRAEQEQQQPEPILVVRR